ncbi:MAG: LamG-like jellyroll fold domain-containing protein [Thermoguttaceae bacterium]|nr:LamG-like jellyroll fold domain-containing protein [Thermoguttaceae bacterium]
MAAGRRAAVSRGRLGRRVANTHSLILTEDTNDVWVRDYGLQFRSPEAPREVVFALGEAEQAADELLSMRPVGVKSLFATAPDGGEVFVLQDVFPHFLQREASALVGRAKPSDRERFRTDMANHSQPDHEVLQETAAVGDWADAAWGSHGLTVVTPWLAQRFPKEIAFGPDGARVAFWSGRSGRELDFRTATLVKDYWQCWADRAPEGADALAAAPSNAHGAARTHDVWLLPRSPADSPQAIAARAKAASQPPLLLADPKWLAATEAVGWPMHPRDEQRFPEEEAVLSEFWDRLMSSYEELRRTGFIAWGDPPHIRGARSQFFRVSGQVDYGLRRHVWGLYARSGDRRYYDYGARFNRFAGDWSIVHHAAGEKFVGGFTTTRPLEGFWSRPLYWGTHSALEPAGGNTGHDIVNWLLEYYLTGDEYVMELTRMHGEAFKAHWEQTARSRDRYDGIFMILRVLANLYAREWDEDFGTMARELARYVIDLDSPNGINDAIRFGSLYKVDRNLISLYYYYRETGDDLAREAFLRGIDYEYRFNRVSGAFAGQAYPSFLFSIAYRWTGDPNYLRVVNASVDEHRRWPGTVNITSQINPTMGIPAGLYALQFPGAEFVDVLDSDAPEVSVFAPEGFRMQGARATDFFRVAAGVESLRLFLGVPAEVRRPDGSVAVAADAGNIGEQQIPVEGHAGAWRLNATQSGIVRLFNAEPLFSRAPQWLVTGAGVEPAAPFKPPSAEAAFVPGRRGGQALHLPGNARLRFPRGEKTAEGYQHFPGGEGTVEFWFRPNWSSGDLPYVTGSRFNDHYFLRAGSHDLQYRRGRARASAPEFASLNLWAHGRESNAGFTGRFWFRAGRWYHLAFAWRTQEGAPGDDGDFAVYVNGEPVAPDDFGRGGILHFWPGRVTGGEPFHRREADESIVIGPIDGTIAQLRVSEVFRYNAAFEPPETLPESDAHTLVQFPLDGDWRGETAIGTEILLLP